MAELNVLKQIEKELHHILDDAEVFINVLNIFLKAYDLEQTKNDGILGKLEFFNRK